MDKRNLIRDTPLEEYSVSEDRKNPTGELIDYPIRAEPLIEVSSITIHTYEHYDGMGPCKVSGSIYIKDGMREENYIYKRCKEDKEIICLGCPLLLTGPEFGVISLFDPVTVHIDLTLEIEDLVGGDGIKFCVEGGKLNTQTELCYHESKSEKLFATNGYACVNYILIPLGIIADVTAKFVKGVGEDDENENKNDNVGSGVPNANIYGSITACYGNTFGASQPPITLYKTLVNADEKGSGDQVSYGVSFALSRSVVCVPAYSSLRVTLDIALEEGNATKQILFCGTNEFRPTSYVTQLKYSSIGDVAVLVNVKYFTSEGVDQFEFYKFGPFDKRSVGYLSFDFSALSMCEKISPLPYAYLGSERTEIISVFVGHNGGKRVELYGTIAIECFGKSHIFRRDKNDPDKSSRLNKTVSLRGLTCLKSSIFTMFVKLKDVEGSFVVDNGISIYYYHYDLPFQVFDRPLCSILLGENGFAVVNYMIFKKAVMAILKVSIVVKDSSVKDSDSFPVVYGTLITQYSDYAYRTSYDRNYWRSILLELQENDACCLNERGEIPLFRNMVSVAICSKLIVEMDLHVALRSASTNKVLEKSAEQLVYKLELVIGDAECKPLVGECYDILFTTDWEDW